MSRPQETFNKRELEKKRLQKRKEKEQKKEERKANAKDGKSFEDMLAYVDENGNITNTPPDPTKKRKISESEVSLESANKGGTISLHERRSGRVTFFNTSKGFGFIQDDESKENVFVHMKSVEGTIKENDLVTFEVGKSFKGLAAMQVRVK